MSNTEKDVFVVGIDRSRLNLNIPCKTITTFRETLEVIPVKSLLSHITRTSIVFCLSYFWMEFDKFNELLSINQINKFSGNVQCRGKTSYITKIDWKSMHCYWLHWEIIDCAKKMLTKVTERPQQWMKYTFALFGN